MPGPEAAYDTETAAGGDLYPSDEDEHGRMLRWALEAFQEADRARRPHEDRWKREYRLYRSYVERRPGDWRSRMFIPISFYVIESVTPKLVAQLPKLLVVPVGPEDVEPARSVEELIGYASSRTGLYEQLVSTYRQALKYGTGILQTYFDRKVRERKVEVPVMEPVVSQTQRIPEIDPATGEQLTDPDGMPLYRTERQAVNEQATGRTRTQVVEDVVYTLPAAESVDISNFWPAPEATSVDDARYVIHRTYRDDAYIRKGIREGTFRMPPWITEDADFWGSESEPNAERLEEVELGGGAEPTRRRAELLSFWTDETCLIVLNRRAVIRAFTNPYSHGEKPFIRVVDHYQEHEFWGVGELEPIEGMQDGINALWNQRIDNVRLILNKVFVGNPSLLHDLRDLNFHPGGMIRTKGNVPPREAIDEFEMSDVTSSSYTESAELERMTEKVTAVSAYQTGTDSPTLNDTATGVALISEQGNARFALKVKMAEITGLVRLARHFGLLLQQYMPEQMAVRRLGEDGQWKFSQVTREGILGALDFDIEAESSTITESVRKEQKLSLLSLAQSIVDPATGQPIANVRQFFIDVLQEFGVKDYDRYLTPTDPMQMLAQILAGGVGGGPVPPSGEQVPQPAAAGAPAPALAPVPGPEAVVA